MTKLNLAKMINPAFDEMLFSDKQFKVLKGGRGSTKSSVISIQLVTEFLADDKANVIVLRKVGKYLRMSVYEQIKWAIYQLQQQNQFRFKTSPLQIIHKRTGTGFYFYGVDDPMKLKSQIIANGYVHALWYEELAEFAGREDIDVVEDTFIRQELPDGKQVKVYYSYNPPRNPHDWINKWVIEKSKDDDYLIHHSTYLDDKLNFLSKQMRRKIEKTKNTDPEYYRWMYLGEITGLGTNVYNIDMFHSIEELSDDDPLIGILFSLDGGHQQSATACSAFGYSAKGNLILLDTFYYSPKGKVVKKAPSELSKIIHEFRIGTLSKYAGVPELRKTIDSAEGALRNQYYHDFQERWNPVAKKKKMDMIDMVASFLVEGRFYYLDTKNNDVFIEEHKTYRFDEKTIDTDDPKVVKENDHTCDVFQYLILDNAKLLGLKA